MKRWTLIALALLIAAGAWLAGATMGPYAMSREPRFPQLTMEQLSDAQKPLAEFFDLLAATQEKLGQRIFDLFHYLRWETSVPLRLNEFAILIVGRQWRSQVEWFAHAPLAIKAGLAPGIVADLKANRRPADMAPEEAAVYDFVTELTTRHEVSDETFDRAKRVLGEQQVVDLTAVAGGYVSIAMILAMSEMTVPPGKEEPFKPGEP